MVNYTNACIYKLCCKDTSIKDVYVGSTCSFRSRKYQHKSICNNEKDKAYNFNVYRFIRANYGWENWDMILLEEVPCENKKQLHKIEREYIEKLGATLNKNIPIRSIQEWKEVYKAKSKKYRENHKEKIREYKKQIITCICGLPYTKQHQSRHYKTKKHRIRISKIKKPLHEELLRK